MKIGQIVSSNSHIDYIGRIIDELDADDPPTADDYGFGQFVSMEFGIQRIVGIIYDSRLVNPEYANFGPRLSPRPALADFTPDFISEQGVLVGIVLLGSTDESGAADHGIPRRVVPAGQGVYTIDTEAVAQFHRSADGSTQMHYFSNLIAHAGALAIPLAKAIIGQLNPLCSESDRQRLAVMTNALNWKHAFGEMGM